MVNVLANHGFRQDSSPGLLRLARGPGTSWNTIRPSDGADVSPHGLLQPQFGTNNFSTCRIIISGMSIDDDEGRDMICVWMAFGRGGRGGVEPRLFVAFAALRVVPRGHFVDRSPRAASFDMLVEKSRA